MFSPPRRPRSMLASWVMAALAFPLFGLIGLGQEPANPLKPPDRSSPRAALKTFLDSGDTLGTFLAKDYLPTPTQAGFQQLIAHGDATVASLNLSDVAPATRTKIGRQAATALYETLSRIPLPPAEEIPDAAPLSQPAGTNAARWIIPNTEIVLERVTTGHRSGEFLFSPETVARADDYYRRVRGLPYARPVPLEHLKEMLITGGGWMISHRWIEALPPWLRIPLAGQAAWKWIALVFLSIFFLVFLRFAYRLSRRGSRERPFRQALAQSLLPASLLVAAPTFAHFALVQLNLLGGLSTAIAMGATVVMFLAGAWICWRLAPVVAEAAIASPNIPTESVDAHLIRICTRLLGMIAGASLLAMGADRLGIPVFGIVAGLGVGGLAIALAAQPTVENLIGGLSLFADKSIRVGDFCRCGSDEGTVETIGIRSTWIRGTDRTLTTIPNAALSKMSVINFGRRDQTMLKSVIGVRYETTPEQLRYLLVKLRELLLSHPQIQPDTARARFIGFGPSSLDIEVFAYVRTTIRAEFLGIQEDVWLRVMDLVEQSGTGFAFPSQTLYLGRDDGLDPQRTEGAEAKVRQWRAEGRLPFPDFSPAEKQSLRGTSIFPPPGSPGQA